MASGWRAAFTKRRLLVALASIVAALVLVELLLRALAPIHTTGIATTYEYDEELGYRHVAGVHAFETTDVLQEVKTNGLGTSNFQESFEGYRSLVFCLGDSYTQGSGLPADMSYPAQLDLALNRDAEGFYARRFGVVNLGVGGYGGQQSLRALGRAVERLGRPAAVLYLGCDNDWADDLLFESGRRHDHLVAGNPRWGALAAPLLWLTTDVQLGLRLKLAIGRLRGGSGAAPSAASRPAGPSVAELEREVLEQLVARAREEGAVPIVSWAGEGPSYEWLERWARDRGVAFADWAPRVRSVREAVPALPVSNHGSVGHHRGWVNRIKADEFARQLRANAPR